MKKTRLAEKEPQPTGEYSCAVVADGFVFVSGQEPVDDRGTGRMLKVLSWLGEPDLDNLGTPPRVGVADWTSSWG